MPLVQTPPRWGSNDVRRGYRPEVDGMRALAILPVVFYHADLGFSGGYIGVDVFFVISGYLITQLILKRGGELSLLEFWERRVRRIVPALTTMLAVSFVAAWLLLFPEDLLRFGRSLAAQSLLLANVFFWRDAGYFDAGAVRPLLHTWSLAVEEQFYLFFPFVLVAARRLPARWLVRLLVAAAVTSFAISAYGVYHHPVATFYLLPARAWELLVGALLAAVPAERLRSGWLSEALSALGVLAILGASLLYDSGVRFPGAAALVPCLGAAAIIAGNTGARTWAGKLLSLRPLVFIGQISYSLYLWHWPVFTGAKYLFAPLSRVDYLGLIAISFALAVASWMLVERPFRNHQALASRGASFVAAGAATAACLVAGAWLAGGDGAPQRWRPEALRYLDGKADSDFRVELQVADVRDGNLVELGGGEPGGSIELLVWGDSHAMAVLHVVDQMCWEQAVRCVAATHSSSVPLVGVPGYGPYSLREDAGDYAQALIELIARERIPKVLLAAVWPAYHELDPDRFRRAAADTVRELGRTGTELYVLKDVPFPGFDVPTALAVSVARGRDASAMGVTRAEHLARNAATDAIFEALQRPRLRLLDPAPALLADLERYALERDGRPLYFDDHHLSTYGASQLRPVLSTLLGPVHPSTARALVPSAGSSR